MTSSSYAHVCYVTKQTALYIKHANKELTGKNLEEVVYLLIKVVLPKPLLAYHTKLNSIVLTSLEA